MIEQATEPMKTSWRAAKPRPNAPALKEPQQEATAQGLARGLSIHKAMKQAGYTRYRKEIDELMQTPPMVERIETIKYDRDRGGSGDLGFLVDTLISLADLAADLGTAAGVREARGLLADAAKLKALLPPEECAPAHDLGEDDEIEIDMEPEAWLAKFAPQR